MKDYLHIQSIEPDSEMNQTDKDKWKPIIWFDPDQNRDYEDLIS